jgi:outer membrane protein assembly factor BamB
MNNSGWSFKSNFKIQIPGTGFSVEPALRNRVKIFVILFLVLLNCCKKQAAQKEEPDPILWETRLPAETYYSSLALSSDEKRVYTGTSTGLLGTHLAGQVFIALDASSGDEIWRLDLERNEVRSTPAIAPDNSIYFTVETRDPVYGNTTGDELWHLSSEGELLWKYDINPTKLTMEIGHSTPAIGTDGTIYVAGDKLYAIYPNGTFRWSAIGSPPILTEALRNAPVIGQDGTIYFVYHNIPLTALNPDNGSVIWSCPLGVNDHCFASPAIGADGTIYVATQPGLVYAVSGTGQIIWTFNLASVGFTGTLRSSPAVDSDGSVYFGINTGIPSSAFFALNPDGTVKWIFEPADLPDDVPSTHFDIYSSPALGSDSIVYFGQEFGRVYGLKKTDGTIAILVNTRSGITWPSPAIDRKGILYINDISGYVYAIQTGSKGLDSLAGWPKFRYNNQNTGRVRK